MGRDPRQVRGSIPRVVLDTSTTPVTKGLEAQGEVVEGPTEPWAPGPVLLPAPLDRPYPPKVFLFLWYV